MKILKEGHKRKQKGMTVFMIFEKIYMLKSLYSKISVYSSNNKLQRAFPTQR